MRHRPLPLALATAGLVFAATLAPAATPPHVSIASINGLRQPLPLPYDEKANADQQVEQAAARAKPKANGSSSISAATGAPTAGFSPASFNCPRSRRSSTSIMWWSRWMSDGSTEMRRFRAAMA